MASSSQRARKLVSSTRPASSASASPKEKKKYNLELGETLRLERPGNATTGYTWTILLSPGLKLEEEGSRSTTTDRRITGAGSIYTWTIKAVDPGWQYVLLWYHRTWIPPTISAEDLIQIQVAYPKEEIAPISPSTQSLPLRGPSSPRASSSASSPLSQEIEVYFDKTMRIVGYHLDGQNFTTLGKAVGHRPSGTKHSASFDVKSDLAHVKGLTFYQYQDDIFYTIADDATMTDKMTCLYNGEGNLVGCPSGGISGRGDGRITNWRAYESLGQIVL